MDYKQICNPRVWDTQPNAIDAVLKIIMSKPGIISFAAGTPDTALLPIELLASLNENAVKAYGRMVLQYGLPLGFPPLIEAVHPLLQKRGVDVTHDASIHISTGGSGELNNACMVFINPGDVILVETPTYSPALTTFAVYGARVIAIPCDTDGIDIAAVEEQLKREKVKAIYLLPTFQNPTGNVMSEKKREQVAQLAIQYHTMILEDDVYYDLRYRGEDIPAVQSYAPTHVIYMTSVSKILAPAMRVGIAVVPDELLPKFLVTKHIIDMTTSTYTQALTAEFLRSDAAKEHIEILREQYAKKMQIMHDALDAHMPKSFSWNYPDGGLFVWVDGPDTFNADTMLEKAIDAGIAYMPGSSFYTEDSRVHSTFRLSFANPSAEKIKEGIAILAKLCKDAANGK